MESEKYHIKASICAAAIILLIVYICTYIAQRDFITETLPGAIIIQYDNGARIYPVTEDGHKNVNELNNQTLSPLGYLEVFDGNSASWVFIFAEKVEIFIR